MEGIILRLTRLEIKKLYGDFDYTVNFNDDITLLYGDNGCGKTTILNILTHIITGKIYSLYKYNFERISLFFTSVENQSKHKIIVENFENDVFNIIFDKDKETIPIKYRAISQEDPDETERYYLSRFSILETIRTTFNYIYLPLSRNSDVSHESTNISNARKWSSSRYIRSNGSITSNANFTLFDVEHLIRYAHNRVNLELKNLSQTFSDEILTSYLDIDNIPSVNQVMEHMLKELNKKDQLQTLQQAYTEVLKTINKWDEDVEKKTVNFFNAISKDIAQIRNSKKQIDLDMLFKMSELIKISNITEMADETKNAQDRIRKPIDDFTATLNSFISQSNNKKEFFIDDDGTLLLKTYNKVVDIQNLSSGEKQIVTFFAYLIFGLQQANQSIFIIDEPELSLHLRWQRMFIDSILSVNPNVQLIFATHAPELIGKHRNKTVKLTPYSTEAGVFNE